MFTLRIVYENGEISNFFLGSYYRLCKKGTESFDIMAEAHYGEKWREFCENKGIVGLLFPQNEETHYAIESEIHYYIMNSNGKTFEKL